jgi:diketogulonate reductase-like aldo/keto reductase
VNLRLLGRTGLKVSEIGFGCGPTAALMITGSTVQRHEAIARALDHGINYYDTAPGYGNAVSEENLGEALHTLRATPYVATKVALEFEHLDDLGAAIQQSVEASLRRLRVGTVSVIQLHNRIGVQRAPKARGNIPVIQDKHGNLSHQESRQFRLSQLLHQCGGLHGSMRMVHPSNTRLSIGKRASLPCNAPTAKVLEGI